MRVANAGNRRLALAVLLALAVTAGCMNENKTVKVGIQSNFRPFTYSEGGENKGFEVELWKAIANKANLKYELVPMNSGELTKALKSGDIDLAVAGMTVNKARKDNFAFSDPYFQTGLVMLTAADNNKIQGKNDLKSKVIATENGSTAFVYAGNLNGVKEIRGYPDISEAYDALAKKHVDAVIFDERNVHHYLQTNGQGKAKMVGEVLNKESYAVVANKKNKYIGRINTAIAAVSKDGTYEALYKQWFGGKPKKLPGG